jgi:hypothetical protein
MVKPRDGDGAPLRLRGEFGVAGDPVDGPKRDLFAASVLANRVA